jgi:hypothetical protein
MVSQISLSSLRRGGGNRPPIGILYGRPGIGKTTFAAHPALKPIFIQTEDGLVAPGLENVQTFGVLASYEDVLQALGVIYENHQDQDWRTVVIDGLDKLEPLIDAFVAQKNGWRNCSEVEYGKGWLALVPEWRNFLDALFALRNHCNMSVLMLAHHKALKVSPPDTDPYMQYGLTLNERIAKLLVAESDFVFFATYPLTTISADRGFGQKTTRAISDKPRLYCQERGGWIAKNRFSMPEYVPFSFDAVARFVPAWQSLAAPASGTEQMEQHQDAVSLQ